MLRYSFLGVARFEVMDAVVTVDFLQDRLFSLLLYHRRWFE